MIICSLIEFLSSKIWQFLETTNFVEAVILVIFLCYSFFQGLSPKRISSLLLVLFSQIVCLNPPAHLSLFHFYVNSQFLIFFKKHFIEISWHSSVFNLECVSLALQMSSVLPVTIVYLMLSLYFRPEKNRYVILNNITFCILFGFWIQSGTRPKI